MKVLIKLFLICFVFLGFAIPSYAERIVVAGSTTVLPIAQKTAEVFMENNPEADISVRGGGSSVGISALIDGTCDIADASRPIKDTEIEKAASNGRDPVAHIVAMDGIAVVVNNSNPISKLSKQQIKDIFTGKLKYWSELGGRAEEIVVVSRDSASGTFEAFAELVMNKEKVRSNSLMQASNQAVAQIVSKTSSAIGYIGIGFLSNALKPIEVDNVVVSKESVLSGKYPITRPLFMYSNGKPQGLVKDYIDFVKSDKGQIIVEEQGYVGLK
jgi:phosphate transport system substrate-binding protein